MRRYYALFFPIMMASALAGCDNPNDKTVMAPPMGEVDNRPEAKAVAPAQTYSDSSSYAEGNPDTSSAPKKR